MTDAGKRPTHPVRTRILVYGGLLLVIWAFLPRWVHTMTYPVPEDPMPAPPAAVTVVDLNEGQGPRIEAWFLPCPREEAPVVVFFHGNAQDLGNLWQSGFLQRFPDLGVHILAIDYPGYGNSAGRPAEAALKAAGERALEWTLTHYPSAPRVLMGWSLGAAVATHTAEVFQNHYAGLVLISPWTSLPDTARAHYPGWLVRLLMHESYDSLTAARNLSTTALVVHGAQDDLIPPAQGRAVAEALGARGTVQWVTVAGHGHNDVLNAGLFWTHLTYYLHALQAAS